MRSLALKLTLAFLLIGLIGAVMMAFFFRLDTQRRFNQFVMDRERYSSITILAEYYEARGSWEGIASAPEIVRFHLSEPGNRYTSWVLVDVNDRVVYATGDSLVVQKILNDAHKRDFPIEVNGHIVGNLLYIPGEPPPPPNSPEANFLAGMTRAILFSALGATAIALILGVLLARGLSRPIRELTEATRSVARGELGQQVEVRTSDEIGRLAAAFNQMSADLARASQARRQMTADIAHELRTPLSLILGYTESLSDGKLPATPETFEIMYDESQRLSRLVDDLRVLSLADAGELELTCQLVEPKPLLDRVAAAHLPEAQERGICLQAEAEEDLPTINVDPGRMAQVLDNLVSNALRFTPDGGRITLSGATKGDRVMLCVADTGSGIAPEDLRFIFDRFYKADASRHRHGMESGLGLAIAKSFVEAQGGSLKAESTLGEGSTFIIELPVA